MNTSSNQDQGSASQTMSGISKPMPMKLFAAWGIDKTPSNCIPRLCTITINRLILFKSLGSDLKTAMIAVKIQGSKRTVRSNEFLIIGHQQHSINSASKQQQQQQQNLTTNLTTGGGGSGACSSNPGGPISSSNKIDGGSSNAPGHQQSLGLAISSNAGSNSLSASSAASSSHISTSASTATTTSHHQLTSANNQLSPASNITSPAIVIGNDRNNIEIDLTFSLQYPHFLKKNVNFLQIMLQRRKRYKSRKILGFKTLAVGVINMSEVMQRRQKMDKELDLVCDIKGSHSSHKSEVVARIMMSSLKCQPIDQDSINRAMRLVGDRSVGGDVDTDDFSSNEEGSDSEMPIGRQTSKAGRAAMEARAAITDRERSEHVGQQGSHSTAVGASQQKNFKQKIIALVKKFRTESDGFDNDQYQAALEQELMQAAASGQGSLAIEELLEEDDLDVDDSESEPEWDEMSVSSTPKPSLRPFFSSTTLNKI